MADNPPYLATPGTAPKALEKIRNAATPERFTADFVNTVLGFKGGTGAALIPFMKRMGFVASDGSPTELYSKFRNSTSSKQAVASALRLGYRALYERNEYIHKASDEDLKGVIVEVTGQGSDSQVVRLIQSTFKAVRALADFDTGATEVKAPPTIAPANDPILDDHPKAKAHKSGLNLSYSINLHLPASDDIKVFDAIFKSLRENLLKE